MSKQSESGRISRRHWLESAAAGAAAFGAASLGNAQDKKKDQDEKDQDKEDKRVIKKGRIKQSIVYWCFSKYWTELQAIKLAKQLGCGSVELLPPKFYPDLKKVGLECAIGSIDMGKDPPFVKGMNNPMHWPQVIAATEKAIDAASQFGFKNVISFTGMRGNLTDKEGADNCVKAFKQVISYAEEKKVTLCLEMLNTRDATHPMKGHPGYQGDSTEYCVDIIKRVGSPNLKLLFDVYHVQIMDGDVIRRIRQHKEYIGHVHTAGNPGRGELNDKQEIAYKPIMEALVEIGYKGYVGQEFIPTGDPMAGIRQAVQVCDV